MKSLKLSLKRRMRHNVMAYDDGEEMAWRWARASILQAQFMVLVFIKK